MKKKVVTQGVFEQNGIDLSNIDFSMLCKITLVISRWIPIGTDEKVNKETQQKHNIDKKAGRWIKFKLARECIQEYLDAANAIYTYHRDVTGRYPEKAVSLLPYKDIEAFYKPEMNKLIEKYWEAVNKFFDNYLEYVEAQKEIQQDLWKKDDYPSLEEVKNKFGIYWKFEPYASCEHLKGKIKDELYDEIKKECDKNNKAVLANHMQDLWDRAYKVVSHLTERLANSDNVFRDSLTGNVKELCETLKFLNWNNDNNLEAMRVEMESKLSNLDLDTLRLSRKIRAEATSTAETIMSQIDSFRRKIHSA